MRTHILIATALLLSATTAHAAPRSLSGAQSNPVEAPAQKVQILEAPAPKVQLLEAPAPKVQVLEAPQAAEQPGIELPKDQPKDQFKAAEHIPPVETAPVRAAPIEDKAVATKPIETAPVAAAPVEASPEPAATPVKQARRKQQHRHVSVERRMEREFRTIGRKIERHIGFALSTGALYHW